jgi:hypothetical protein
MRQPEPNEASKPSRGEVPVPSLACDRAAPRNLSLLRLEEADRRVRRRLVVVRSLLRRAGVETRIAEGSAIAAEILLADENLRRRAIRANLLVVDRTIERAADALIQGGFRRIGSARPGGSATVELLKRAARDRRGAVHVVFDEDLAPAGELRERVRVPTPPFHPGSDEAAAERARRLARYRLEPTVLLERRWAHEAIRGRLEEILEVGLVIDRLGSA